MAKFTSVFITLLLILSCASEPTPLSKGKTALKQKKQTEALSYFEEALKANPNNVVARFYAAEIYSAQGKYDKAIEYFTVIANLEKYSQNQQSASYNITAIYFNQKKYKAAIEAASKIGFSGRKIITMSLKQLNIPYDLDAHPQSEINIPYPEGEKKDTVTTWVALVLDEKGKSITLSCGGHKEERKRCEYASPYFKDLTFKPPYDIKKYKPSASTVFANITFKRGENAKISFNTIVGNVIPGQQETVIMGALPWSIIDKFIREKLDFIRWCYERELSSDSSLQGKIIINFIIGATGKVAKSSVKRTTMHNEKVEQCVARQIKKIVFPKPAGGGIVIVNYPFGFKSSVN